MLKSIKKFYYNKIYVLEQQRLIRKHNQLKLQFKFLQEECARIEHLLKQNYDEIIRKHEIKSQVFNP